MAAVFDIRVFSLLTARLCHELAGPLAAVGNGIELLADPDPVFVREAQHLVTRSAAGAANRLHFYRFAYGFAGDGAAAAEPPAKLACRFFAATPIACSYAPAAGLLPPEWQRLACNLLLVGADGLPRGGRVAVTADRSELAVDAEGVAAALAPELRAALAAAVSTAELTPKTAQAYFCALLAGALGRRLRIEADGGGRLRIVATGC